MKKWEDMTEDEKREPCGMIDIFDIDPETKGLRARVYLGDGLYAGWDGYHVWLMAERDGSIHRVALTDYVMDNLLDYMTALNRLASEVTSFQDAPIDGTEGVEPP